MENITTRLCSTFVKELWNPKKTTFQHFSSKNGVLSWRNSIEGQRQNDLDVHVINDPCESTFGIFSDQITSYNHIGATNAGGMVLCKKNRDFSSGLKKVNKNDMTCVYEY